MPMAPCERWHIAYPCCHFARTVETTRCRAGGGHATPTVDPCTPPLLVRKNPLSETELHRTAPLPLATGQVRVQIDCFALTANNITYAAMGDMLQYWQFFPAPSPAGHHSGVGFWLVQGVVPPGGGGGRTAVWVLAHGERSRTQPRQGVGCRVQRWRRAPGQPACGLQPLLALQRRSFINLIPKKSRPRCARCTSHPGSSTTFWPIRTFMVPAHCCCPAPPAKRPTAPHSSSHSARHARGRTHLARQPGLLRKPGLLPPRGGVRRTGNWPPIHRAFTSTLPAAWHYASASTNTSRNWPIAAPWGASHVGDLGGAGSLPGPRPVMFFAPRR